MNYENRDLIVRLINNYHKFIKLQLDIFFDKQRKFQFILEIKRSKWLNYNKSIYRLEEFWRYNNTITNIKELKQKLPILDLQYQILIDFLITNILKKYKKSDKSFIKFIDKLQKNQLKNYKVIT